MIQKIIIITLVGLFGFGYYAASASSAIATNETEENYVETHAQSFTPGDVALDATRDEITVDMLTVVRHPIYEGAQISSGFGWRNSACRGCSSNHKGADYTPGAGVAIYAISHGEVVHAGSLGSLGQTVKIRHTINGETIYSLYAHMQHGSIPVHVGQQIGIGERVGNVGRTGTATGAHLHFEIHRNGVAINPVPWLAEHINIGAWDHLT